jgi:pimeloyl-ACP methyl ester carboxylesterase
MDLWDTHLIRELSSRYKVIVFDNRGIGKTTASDKPFSVKLFAEDTIGLMDALKIGKTHVLGWSMGTFIAMEMILKYPERVDKAILYAGSCGWKGKDVVQANPAVSAKLVDLSGTQDERGTRLVSILFPKKWLDDHPDFLKNIPVPREAPSLAVVEKQGKAIESWAGVCSRLDSIANPTLLITGVEDLVIPPDNSLLMASRINNSWLVRIPGGHSAMYQYPKTFSRCLIAFLEGGKE